MSKLPYGIAEMKDKKWKGGKYKRIRQKINKAAALHRWRLCSGGRFRPIILTSKIYLCLEVPILTNRSFLH